MNILINLNKNLYITNKLTNNNNSILQFQIYVK